MKNLLALFVLMSSTCFCDLLQAQKSLMWFSEDFKTFYIQVVLVPEEDSPFHYGMWGQERGTHVYEMDFFEQPREFKHSLICKCKAY